MPWSRLPAKPKTVLMALADEEDERTGHVCYGKTDLDHIARKASVPLAWRKQRMQILLRSFASRDVQ